MQISDTFFFRQSERADREKARVVAINQFAIDHLRPRRKMLPGDQFADSGAVFGATIFGYLLVKFQWLLG